MMTLLRLLLIGPPAERFRWQFRWMVRARNRGHRRLALILAARLQRFGVHIAPGAVLPESTVFPHPTNIVIGDGVVLEDNVTLYQGVTLGGLRSGDAAQGRYPVIGANCVIFAGAVVAGAVTVGKNCTIGANSVVTAHVPDQATAVGAPARVICTKGPAPSG